MASKVSYQYRHRLGMNHPHHQCAFDGLSVRASALMSHIAEATGDKYCAILLETEGGEPIHSHQPVYMNTTVVALRVPVGYKRKGHVD